MRASNLVIGTTTLAVIAVALGGFLGFRKLHAIRQQGPLRIVFEGSASGLRNGGSVNFDGVQIGEIKSLKLDNPRKVVAYVMVDNSAPIRKDTVVGLEFQGLTGIAAISLTGGAAAASPPPLDEDGVPVLTADLTENQSIRDSLHNVDRLLLGNRTTIKNALLNFETYTASLASESHAIDDMIGKVDNAFASIDSAIARVDDLLPGFSNGNADELLGKVQSIRELADSFKKKSATMMEEGRRSLLDVSEAANNMTRKINPQALVDSPPPPRKPAPKSGRRVRPADRLAGSPCSDAAGSAHQVRSWNLRDHSIRSGIEVFTIGELIGAFAEQKFRIRISWIGSNSWNLIIWNSSGIPLASRQHARFHAATYVSSGSRSDSIVCLLA